MCYPLYGQDITAETTPMEAGMQRFVDLGKDFIGKAALIKEKKENRSLIYFTTTSRRAPRHNYHILKSGSDIGIVTSGSFSPSLSCGIGMGYVASSCAVGTELIIKENGLEIPAVVTGRPFFKNGTAKISENAHADT
jgi:aminomethyltransferase